MPEVDGTYYTDLKRPGFLGLTVQAEVDFFGSKLIHGEYQPGNGTRYEVQLVNLRDLGRRFISVLGEIGSSMEIPYKILPYQARWLNKHLHRLTEGDCWALIPLINEFIDLTTQERA